MNRNQRIAIVLGGLVAVVGAFVVLNPGDDDGGSTTATTAPTITRTAPAPTSTATTETTPSSRPSAPSAPLLTRGKVTEIKVKSGEIVRFRVRSSVPEEIHVHGYDITSPVEPGATSRIAFRARLEGIFEIELHGSSEQIGKLVVEP